MAFINDQLLLKKIAVEHQDGWCRRTCIIQDKVAGINRKQRKLEQKQNWLIFRKYGILILRNKDADDITELTVRKINETSQLKWIRQLWGWLYTATTKYHTDMWRNISNGLQRQVWNGQCPKSWVMINCISSYFPELIAQPKSRTCSGIVKMSTWNCGKKGQPCAYSGQNTWKNIYKGTDTASFASYNGIGVERSKPTCGWTTKQAASCL